MNDSMFVRTFGSSPKVRVLDFLLDNSELDWSKSDMARQTGISRATLDGFFDNLARDKVIVHTRVIGRARLFRLNKKMPLVRKLIELDRFLSRPMEKKVKI